MIEIINGEKVWRSRKIQSEYTPGVSPAGQSAERARQQKLKEKEEAMSAEEHY